MEERTIELYAEDFSEEIWEKEYCEPLGVPSDSRELRITVKDVQVIRGGE